MCLPLLALGAAAAVGGVVAASMSKKSKPSPLQPPPVAQELSSSDIDTLKKSNVGPGAKQVGTPSTLLDPKVADTTKNTLLGQ